MKLAEITAGKINLVVASMENCFKSTSPKRTEYE